jgi:uncharacterized membrane protein
MDKSRVDPVFCFPHNGAMQDSKRKSLLKAVSWQLLGLVSSLLISWFFTGSLMQAGAMTIVMTTTAFVMYFLHERFWAQLKI